MGKESREEGEKNKTKLWQFNWILVKYFLRGSHSLHQKTAAFGGQDTGALEQFLW